MQKAKTELSAEVRKLLVSAISTSAMLNELPDNVKVFGELDDVVKNLVRQKDESAVSPRVENPVDPLKNLFRIVSELEKLSDSELRDRFFKDLERDRALREIVNSSPIFFSDLLRLPGPDGFTTAEVIDFTEAIRIVRGINPRTNMDN